MFNPPLLDPCLVLSMRHNGHHVPGVPEPECQSDVRLHISPRADCKNDKVAVRDAIRNLRRHVDWFREVHQHRGRNGPAPQLSDRA